MHAWDRRRFKAERAGPSSGDLKVTPEVVERIKRLRRLGKRVADIAQLCGRSMQGEACQPVSASVLSDVS
jgi:hypothetical protein